MNDGILLKMAKFPIRHFYNFDQNIFGYFLDGNLLFKERV